MGLFNLIKVSKVSAEKDLYPTKPCLFYVEANGVNCNVLVKKDEEVEVGQVLAKEKEDFSIPLLSSVKGKVIEIRDTYNTQGKKTKAIVVEPIESVGEKDEEIKLESLNKEEILDMIQKFALLDEEGVPLSIKYRAFSGKKLIIKKFSYEPNFVGYQHLFKKNSEINKGIEVIKKLFDSIEIKEVDSKSVKNKTIELKKEEFVKSIFGSEVTSNDVIIEDLSTIVYLGECFLTGKPHLNEYVVVSGGAMPESTLLNVRIGTTLEEIFENLNGKKELLEKTIIGGALKGNPQIAEDSAISLNAKSILFLSGKDTSNGESSPCIRCAKCLRVCPEGINPIKLVELWERNEKEEFLKFGGKKCIECGLCSYVCPSKIEIVNKIVTAKTFVK